ncbi:hypothetical protein Patl1_11466 [Pistacia atlantica]|uniref:Uncharacterized protein n=1 Tax=Pistacia atlantica TaxID=434234 RepID=A0ACC1A849_9ROSI|nr:hypothetical protein Patl1_11466 [Pistacia atlantica]
MVMDSRLNSKWTLLQQTNNVDLHHLICWCMPKKLVQQDEIPQALAALTLDTTIAKIEWTTNTGASNHMTGKPGMLTNLRKYSRADSVLIGDGSSMPILAIGDSYIKQKASTIPFYDVLLEHETRQAMIIGKCKGDLYVLPTSPELYFSHQFKSGTTEVWHQRLGHP